MSESIPHLLDSTRLLFDLQRGNDIAQRFSGNLDPQAIARCVTDGLVETFGCAFARIWLVEPDRAALRLVASSGMYTRLDGAFARVPMGAYKVGKIAQNRISFLSNNLPEEAWVKDRDWAIANGIRGFAGYPLAVHERVVGVLAAFSHQALAAEFLEALQTLCMTTTVALDTALSYQRAIAAYPAPQGRSLTPAPPLSDQIASLLHSARLTLVGTERPLTPSLTWLFLRAVEVLHELECSYCRLTYRAEAIALEAIVAAQAESVDMAQDWVRGVFRELVFVATCLGGELQTYTGANPQVIQVMLNIPYPRCALGPSVSVRCTTPMLQCALTHLAHSAGLSVLDSAPAPVVLTDDVQQLLQARSVIWVQHSGDPLPKGVTAHLGLRATPSQLREAVEAVLQGQPWGNAPPEATSLLSDREREIITLLAQGLRDRDIAHRLIISESTVKFHINNTLAKLKARNRYQVLYQSIINGWIP